MAPAHEIRMKVHFFYIASNELLFQCMSCRTSQTLR